MSTMSQARTSTPSPTLTASSPWYYRLPPTGSVASCPGYSSSSTSESSTSAKDVPFLGRALQRDEVGINLQVPKTCMLEMVALLVRTSKAVGTTGTTTPAKKEDGA